MNMNENNGTTDLKDFIKEVISSISNSIKELNEEMCTNGLAVNPSSLRNAPIDVMVAADGRIIKDIHFDISINVSRANDSNGGIRLKYHKCRNWRKIRSINCQSGKFFHPCCLPFY